MTVKIVPSPTLESTVMVPPCARGLGKEHDRPSARYGSTPVDGPSAGISVLPHWEAMLRNYYELLGWDPETGIPLPSTLESLGIGYVNEDLEELR